MRSRRSRLAVVVPLALAALPASAGAAGWTTGVAASAVGASATAPRVAADAHGGVTAAWLRDGRVQAGVRGANGTFSAVDVSATGASAPQLAVDASGRAVLAWVRDGVVEASIRPSADAPFAASVALSRAGAGEVRVAMDDAGTATVLWIRGNAVQIARRAAGDAAWPAEVATFAEQQPSVPALAATRGGRAMAVWSAVSGSAWTLRAASAGPGPWTAATDVEDVDDIAGLGGVGVDLAADGADDVTGVWAQHLSYPFRAPELVTARSVGGAAFGTHAPISAGPVNDTASSPRPAVAANAAGDAAAVWLHRQEDVFTVELAQRAGTSAFTAPVPASQPGADDVAPDVALDAAGRAAVVWVRGAAVEALRTPASSAALSGAGESAPQVAVDAAGNAVVVWVRDGRIETAAFDQTAPTVAMSMAPTATATGADELFEASAADSESPAEIRWDFGDGITATGTSVRHRYLKPGTYAVKATAVDAGGNTATQGGTVTVTGDPVIDPPRGGSDTPVTPGDKGGEAHDGPMPPGGGVPITADRTAPRVTGLAIARKVRSGRAAKITIKLDEAARVVVRVKRGARTLPGSVSVKLASGKRTITLKGRLAGRKLQPGRYTLVVVATDAAGSRSAPKRLTFRVVR